MKISLSFSYFFGFISHHVMSFLMPLWWISLRFTDKLYMNFDRGINLYEMHFKWSGWHLEILDLYLGCLLHLIYFDGRLPLQKMVGQLIKYGFFFVSFLFHFSCKSFIRYHSLLRQQSRVNNQSRLSVYLSMCLCLSMCASVSVMSVRRSFGQGYPQVSGRGRTITSPYTLSVSL